MVSLYWILRTWCLTYVVHSRLPINFSVLLIILQTNITRQTLFGGFRLLNYYHRTEYVQKVALARRIRSESSSTTDDSCTGVVAWNMYVITLCMYVYCYADVAVVVLLRFDFIDCWRILTFDVFVLHTHFDTRSTNTLYSEIKIV